MASSKSYQAPVTTLRLVRERIVEYKKPIKSASDAYDLLRPFMEDLAQEAFFVVGLNNRNHVNVVHQVALGCPSGVAFEPSDIAKVLLLTNSTGAIVSHNHPAGTCEPSPEDRSLTKRIGEIMKLLGFRFLDHVIIGNNRYFSFQEAGAIT